MNLFKVIGWTDYGCTEYPPNRGSSAADRAVEDCIRVNGYRFGGDSHQDREGCCPVLNDGTKMCYSMRGWGGIMARALKLDDSDGYAYMEWYMDGWSREGMPGLDCPPRETVYPSKGVDRSMIDRALCGKVIHEMRLADEPFSMIACGEKTVEVRLNDEKRRSISKGDIILFYRQRDMFEMCAAEVVGLRRFQSFSAVFSSDLFAETGCKGVTTMQAAERMYRYYTATQEKKYGVLAIEIKLIGDRYDLCDR